MERHLISSRAIASWLPTMAAPAMILVAGLLAHGQNIRLAETAARVAAVERLEAARPIVERGLRERLSSLRSFASALDEDPPATATDFARTAERFTAEIPGLVAATVELADGRTLVLPTDDPVASRVAEGLQASANRRSLDVLPIEGDTALTLSAPVAEPTDGSSPPARLTLVLTGDSLLPPGGTTQAERHLGLSIVPLRDGPGDGLPNSADVPLALAIDLPEGGLALTAATDAGWRDVPPVGWVIPLLAVLSAGVVVAPIARTRQLVSERRRNLRELGQHKNELARLSQRHGLALGVSRLGVWDYDLGRDVLVWDARMDEIYGYVGRAGPRVYRDWARRIHPEDLARAEADFADAIDRFGEYDSRFRIVLEDGSVRHVQAKGAVYSSLETGSRIVGVNWDVSEQTRLTAELTARREEAESASRTKSKFLATMSHEIRTPMNGILGMLGILLESDVDPQQRERLEIACASAEHLLTILNDVLDFSKLEADRIELQPRSVDVCAIVRETVALMSAAAQAQAVSLHAEIDASLPTRLFADPTRLRQILLNLVGNAVKFTEGGTISVSARYDPGAAIVTFSVRDTGMGIPEKAIPDLFQRFAQVDSSDTRARGGTGLGLAICKQLVELMDGGISVRSVETLGSTFTFWFPAEADVVPQAAPPRPDAPSAAAASGPLRVLVAEDNPTNQHVLRAYLDLGGHAVTMTGNGQDCVDRALSGVFDLIIMDVQMPKMDGVEATRLIRARKGPVAATPIIALTASTSRQDRDRFLAAGMDAHVAKPVSIAELNAAIAAVTTNATRPKAPRDASGAAPAP